MTRADRSRDPPGDSPSDGPLGQPFTQEDITNAVQQVVPGIVQQVLATLQPPAADNATRSSGSQQSTDASEQRRPNSSGDTTEGNSLPSTSSIIPLNNSGETTQGNSHTSTSGITPLDDSAITPPGLGKPSSDLQ